MPAELIFEGDVLLSRAPQSDLHAATKAYVDVLAASKAGASHTHQAANITDLGSAAICNTGTSSGNVPVLGDGGKLALSVMPAYAVINTFTAASEAEQLALTTAERGDLCIRTDLSTTYVLSSDDMNAYATLTNWTELLSPTGAVTSVNGEIGAVTVSAVPSGGTTGQVLTKTAAGFGWADVTSSGGTYSDSLTGSGSTTSFVINHNLNFQAVQVDVFKQDGTSLIPVFVSVTRTTANAIQIDFAVAPISGVEYTVICRK